MNPCTNNYTAVLVLLRALRQLDDVQSGGFLTPPSGLRSWPTTFHPPESAPPARRASPPLLHAPYARRAYVCDGLDLHGPSEAYAVWGERAVTRARGGARTLPTAAPQPGALRCRLCGGLRQFSRVCKHAEREIALGTRSFVLVAKAWRTLMVGLRMWLKNPQYTLKVSLRRHARVGLHQITPLQAQHATPRRSLKIRHL